MLNIILAIIFISIPLITFIYLMIKNDYREDDDLSDNDKSGVNTFVDKMMD